MRHALLAVLAANALLAAPVSFGAQPSSSTSSGTDARSVASDAQVGVARRAYRAACQRVASRGYCECMTGGMAQILAPADLNIATAQFTNPRAGNRDQRRRVDAARSEVAQGCTGVR